MKRSLAIRSSLVIAYLLVACFSLWIVKLTAAFSWRPGGSSMQTWFNVSEWLCYLLALSVIGLFWKPRWASLVAFLCLIGLAEWLIDMPTYFFSALYNYGLFEWAYLFYLICFLAYVYCLVMSLMVFIKSFLKKLLLLSTSVSEIRYIALLIAYLLSAGFFGYWATDTLDHASMHNLPLPGKWLYHVVQLASLLLIANILFFIPKGKKTWLIVGFGCLLFLLPQCIDYLELLYQISEMRMTGMSITFALPLIVYVIGLVLTVASYFRVFRWNENADLQATSENQVS